MFFGEQIQHLSIYLKVELLVHSVWVFSVLVDIAKSFPKLLHLANFILFFNFNFLKVFV